jgi:hypothetical protein
LEIFLDSFFFGILMYALSNAFAAHGDLADILG